MLGPGFDFEVMKMRWAVDGSAVAAVVSKGIPEGGWSVRMLVGIRNGTAVYTYITGHAENDPVQKCAWRLQCLGGFICYVLVQSNGGNTKFPDSAVFGIQFITSLYVCNDAEHIRALAEGRRKDINILLHKIWYEGTVYLSLCSN